MKHKPKNIINILYNIKHVFILLSLANNLAFAASINQQPVKDEMLDHTKKIIQRNKTSNINQDLKKPTSQPYSNIKQGVNKNKILQQSNGKYEPRRHNYESRIQEHYFNENKIYTLWLKPGFQSHILFEEGESIKTVSIGENYAFKVNILDNRLFIRPLEDNIKTNMTVITNKRSYEFDLIIGKTPNQTYVLKFIYSKNHD